MKAGCEFVWLNGVQRGVFRDYCRRVGKRRSAVLRRALLRLAQDEKDVGLEAGLLDEELRVLEDEDRQLCRMQRLILKNHVYLHAYVKQVMQGGWDSGRGRRRPALPETPESAVSIKALEGIFARRSELGRLVAELATKHYSGVYNVGPVEVKSGFQTGFLHWPECPYWLTSEYNRRFEGPPDRRWCDKGNREVQAEKCMICWESGMKDAVANDPDWNSWRRSRDYQRQQEFDDIGDFEENSRLLAGNRKKREGGKNADGASSETL